MLGAVGQQCCVRFAWAFSICTNHVSLCCLFRKIQIRTRTSATSAARYTLVPPPWRCTCAFITGRSLTSAIFAWKHSHRTLISLHICAFIREKSHFSAVFVIAGTRRKYLFHHVFSTVWIVPGKTPGKTATTAVNNIHIFLTPEKTALRSVNNTRIFLLRRYELRGSEKEFLFWCRNAYKVSQTCRRFQI